MPCVAHLETKSEAKFVNAKHKMIIYLYYSYITSLVEEPPYKDITTSPKEGWQKPRQF